MTEIPVSKEVLVWARNFRNLDEVEAADRLGIPVTELHAYEAGQQKPTLTMFEKFAAQYRLPTATLFRLTPPEEPAMPEDFRTLDGRNPRFSFDFHSALSDARTLLHQLARIAADDDEFVPPELPNRSGEKDPEKLAADERERLGISVEDQLRWRGSEGFRRWRAILENTGVTVFVLKFPLDDCRGFTLIRGLPLIVVNKSEWAETARTFTLMHEYCHLLIRKPGISDQSDRSPIEAFCNKFASAFLMPTDALRAVLPYWPNEPVDWDAEDIEGWALRLKVSQRALALRLESLGLAPEGFYRKFAWPVPKRSGKSTPGGNYVNTRLNEIGGNFVQTVVSALDRQVINRAEAVEALAMSADHFDKARASVERNRALAGAE